MKKIIHLSDLHIGYRDCGKRFRDIIDNIAFLKQPASSYVVVITGDLEENANDPLHAEEAMESVALLEKMGYRVLLIPGNHDYGTGAMGNPDLVALFKERFYRTRDVVFPKLDIIEGVAFIGLDSTAEELDWHDRVLSEGELGHTQLLRLQELLDGKKLEGLRRVIYLHHHPFSFKLWRHLRDSEELGRVIGNKVDMLMFGHYHRNKATAGRVYHGKWGIRRCYNAGSATHKNGNVGFHRVIDLTYDDPRMDYDGQFI